MQGNNEHDEHALARAALLVSKTEAIARAKMDAFVAKRRGGYVHVIGCNKSYIHLKCRSEMNPRCAYKVYFKQDETNDTLYSFMEDKSRKHTCAAAPDKLPHWDLDTLQFAAVYHH